MTYCSMYMNTTTTTTNTNTTNNSSNPIDTSPSDGHIIAQLADSKVNTA